MENIRIKGRHHQLEIDAKDSLTRKLAMLIEATNIGVKNAIEKYGYTEQRYYQLLNKFKEFGSDGLIDKPKGPKSNYVRTDQVIKQILRYRFLDPNAKIAVLTQKMQQSGFNVSQRSVERTISEYGLQKKTPYTKSRQGSYN